MVDLFQCWVQEDESVRLVGVEASGHGLGTDKHAATLTRGTPGVLHGSFSFLLQDAEGQVIDPHSISAGWAATLSEFLIPVKNRRCLQMFRHLCFIVFEIVLQSIRSSRCNSASIDILSLCRCQSLSIGTQVFVECFVHMLFC